MFKLDISSTYWAKVELPVHADNKIQRFEFDVCFNRLSKSEIRALSEAAKKGELTDEQLVQKVVADWKNIVNESGEPIPFNASSVELVSERVVNFCAKISEVFFATINGVREKN